MTAPLNDEALRRLLALGEEGDEEEDQNGDANGDDRAGAPESENDSKGEPADGGPRPGATIGPYRIVRELGRGGMGVVYEARDERLDRRVALKVLTGAAGSGGESRELRARFAREALAAARLQHPNIAEVYEATPERIAMRLVDGVPLDRVPRDDARRLARLVAEAARAVDFAHRRGIVHRDLKPSNLLVERESDSIFVVDFGLAKEPEAASISMTGQLLGTPAYMAPEQARGESFRVDARTDVYGLGATLWACLAGRPPFEGTDLVRLLERVVDRPPDPLRARSRGVDRDLETVIGKAMAKEPERRYARASDLADDLENWLASRPIRARPPSLGYRLGKFARRRRGPLLAAGAAALVVAIGALVAVTAERAARRASETALRLSNAVAALVRDGEDAFRSGDLGIRDAKLRRAEALCRDALAEREVPQGHFLLGSLRYRRRALEDALASLDRALELEPDLDEARFLRGIVVLELVSGQGSDAAPASYALGHWLEQARKDLRVHERSDLSFRRVDVLYGEARLALLEDGDEATARAHLRSIVDRLDPTHVQSLRALADLVRDEDSDEALRLDARAMDLEGGLGVSAALAIPPAPTVTGAPVPDAGPVVAPGDVADAVAALESMHRAAALRRVGQVVEAEGAWNEAVMRCDRALDGLDEDDDRRGAVLNNRAVARAELERIALARGRALDAMTRRMQALEDLDAALRGASPPVEARINRARLHERQADHLAASGLEPESAAARDRAAADWRAALERLPSFSPHRDGADAALAALERHRR